MRISFPSFLSKMFSLHGLSDPRADAPQGKPPSSGCPSPADALCWTMPGKSRSPTLRASTGTQLEGKSSGKQEACLLSAQRHLCGTGGGVLLLSLGWVGVSDLPLRLTADLHAHREEEGDIAIHSLAARQSTSVHSALKENQVKCPPLSEVSPLLQAPVGLL